MSLFLSTQSGVEFNTICNARTPSVSATHALQHDYGITMAQQQNTPHDYD